MFGFWAGQAWAQAPALPPGVALEAAPAGERLPTRISAHMITVDWTHPLLRVRLADGVQGGGASVMEWSTAERRRPGVLRIQLAEPVQAGGKWQLALPVTGPLGAMTSEKDLKARGDVLRRPFFGINGLCPWVPGGAAVAREAEFVSPLADAGALAGARWMGRLEDLDAISSLTLESRALFSWTRPDLGRTRFALVVNESGGEISIKDLLPWLAGVTGIGDWLAIHSQGPQATVGAGDWRLGGSGDPRRAERLGGALELGALTPGEMVDWARLQGAAVKASSFETGYEPANLIKGLLWPAPFSTCVWQSKPGGQGDPAPWVELDLGQYRPVERIVVAWASAAGWSGQFQPGRVVLSATLEGKAAMEMLDKTENPGGLWYVHSLGEVTPLRSVRLEVEPPRDQPLDRRGRLAAVQAWGPWDGKTGK